MHLGFRSLSFLTVVRPPPLSPAPSPPTVSACQGLSSGFHDPAVVFLDFYLRLRTRQALEAGMTSVPTRAVGTRLNAVPYPVH